jgi:hypothetical protein
MILNRLNGTISFEELSITSQTVPSQLMVLGELFDVKMVITNGEYRTLSLRKLDDGKLAILVNFKNDKISSVSIGLDSIYGFPPFVVTDEEITIVRSKLNAIGGAKSYEWGKVEQSIDQKGGAVTIFVSYKG